MLKLVQFIVRGGGWIALFLLLVVSLGFFALNTAPVPLDYYFGNQQISLAFALFFALVVGVLLTLFGTMGVLLRQKRQIAKLNKKVRSRESELTHLRTITAGNDRA